jgi:hypothetical protein
MATPQLLHTPAATSGGTYVHARSSLGLDGQAACVAGHLCQMSAPIKEDQSTVGL